MRSIGSVLADNVPLAGPAASDLPWWTPIAVSAVLLLIALAYVLRHRRRRTPEGPAAQASADETMSPALREREERDPPTPGLDARALVRDGFGA